MFKSQTQQRRIYENTNYDWTYRKSFFSRSPRTLSHGDFCGKRILLLRSSVARSGSKSSRELRTRWPRKPPIDSDGRNPPEMDLLQSPYSNLEQIRFHT
ncbi:MAG TPA: hypothetical protein DCL41_08615 [Bdellovibrionales bacterium]|nr:hypothetical protein [Bdellovibrionales bacterium]